MKVKFPVAVSVLLILCGTAHAAEIPNSPEALELPVTTLVSGDLFEDTPYQLDPIATIFRGRAFFELRGAERTEVIVGVRELQTRRDEVAAVAALQAMKKTSVYGEALKNAGTAPIDLAKNLATSPVETSKRIGRGIGGFFADVGYSITGDDADQENVAKTALGWGAAKRGFAFELGVNPYTRYRPLEDELGEVAWTAVGGSFTASIGFRAIGGTPGTVTSVSKLADGMRKLVRDNSPRKLKNLNADKLAAMGVSESLVEALLSNQRYDPETETRFVGALESMQGVAGRERFVKRAALVTTREDALLMRDWAELFAAYHGDVQALREVLVVSSSPLAVRADGPVQALYPSDYIPSSQYIRARQRSLAEMLTARGYQLGGIWVTGSASDDAHEMVESTGWQELRTGVEATLFATDAAAPVEPG